AGVGGGGGRGGGWQGIVGVNGPVAVAAIPLVFARIREASGPGGRADVPGLVLAAAAALGLVWALVRANTVGWGSAETAGALAAGAVAAVAFTAWQRRARAPMLPLRL